MGKKKSKKKEVTRKDLKSTNRSIRFLLLLVNTDCVLYFPMFGSAYNRVRIQSMSQLLRRHAVAACQLHIFLTYIFPMVFIYNLHILLVLYSYRKVQAEVFGYTSFCFYFRCISVCAEIYSVHIVL